MDSEDAKKPTDANVSEGDAKTRPESGGETNPETEKSAVDRETAESGGSELYKSEEKGEEAKSDSAEKAKMEITGSEQIDNQEGAGQHNQPEHAATPTEASKNEKESSQPDQKQNGEPEGAVGGSDTVNLNGKYTHVKSENLEDFFRAIGVPWLMRKLLKQFNHSTEIVQDGSKFDIKMITGFMTKEWKFTVGEDFDDTPMGWNKDPMIVHSAWEGEKLVMNHVPKSDKAKAKAMKVTRQLSGNELTIVIEVGDVVCTRIFKKKN